MTVFTPLLICVLHNGDVTKKLEKLPAPVVGFKSWILQAIS